ncbi:MAG: N-acetyltransferase family protein [Propionibacteriaceae bacterium]|nr:N-acetyltransferase family protein [Propionibacteriaceae bacterium]
MSEPTAPPGAEPDRAPQAGAGCVDAGPPVVIRYADPTDAGAMLEIFNREVAQTISSWEWFALSEADWRDWVDEHTKDDHVLLVAEAGGRVVGFAGYGTFRTKAGYVSTAEDSVFLDESFRGHGVGKRLLARLLDEARARQIHVMVAAITSENLVSIGLHQTLGFEQVGYLPQVGHKFGRWLDLVLLQITLDNRPTP